MTSKTTNRHIASQSKSELVIKSIIESIRNGNIMPGAALPSVKEASSLFGVAPKTVVRSYEKLKKQGFIESRPRKGYFVISKQSSLKTRVLLIVHSFDAHFEFLYRTFHGEVEQFCDIEIYFHHYNVKLLELIVTRNIDNYDLFIISSFDHPKIPKILGRIPSEKVLVVSRIDRLENQYNSIFQDFEKGTYNALNEAKPDIRKYKEIVLSFPIKSGHSITLKNGFEKFCKNTNLKFQVADSLDNLEIEKGNVYLVIDDRDLIKLLRFCKIRNWEPGKEIGVISYNESPLKEIIRDGITVISCDFRHLAKEMAQFIINRKSIYKSIPIKLIKRNSL